MSNNYESIRLTFIITTIIIIIMFDCSYLLLRIIITDDTL